MERLDSFDFNARPNRSRYADVVKALVDEQVFAVRIKRGEKMFPDTVQSATVQSGVRTALRNAGKRAKVRAPSEDEIVVGLNTDQAPRKRGRRREAVAA